MDEQEYLDKISATTKRPVEQSKLNKILSSKIFIVSAIGLVLLIIIMIIGAALGGGQKEPAQAYELKLHLDGTASVITEYQPYVKSSSLRSSSASLNGVLANTSRELSNYLADKYVVDEKDEASSALMQAAIRERDSLANDLFEAKINGILDRIYAHKMAYEISIITAEEANIINSTQSDTLYTILLDSYNSLKNLYDQFNNFSETK